jgi:cell division protease FtsH
LNRFFRSALFPLIVIVLLVYLASQTIMGDDKNEKKWAYSQVQSQVRTDPGAVKKVTFNPNKRSITMEFRDGDEPKAKSNYPSDHSQRAFESVLLEKGVEFDSKGTGSSAWWTILTSLLPFVLLFGFWIFLMNQVQGGGSKVMSFGKSRAKRMTPDSPKIGFKDVAGVDEAVEELHEIKEFLENPKKFQALGARIPKGVLLYGPPGTGKTLLARAVAGEAGVPFFSISGSDFVEMFVGVGASRVRDLFEQAKQAAPCIVFMDEIDAVGRHRGAGLGGGHDEREQTLNQLLVEMDGFELKDNIILVAATNRPDILDPALLRPGRFDRQIVVDRPDRNGRKKILEVHAKGKPLASEIELDTLAAGTPGFTGADLANLVNEAALLAARRGKKTIGQEELEEGIMRVIAGPEKKTRLFSEEERKVTAYHEMGHALVGHYLDQDAEVHKISIISRGQALGYTISLPREDRYLTTKTSLMDQLAMTLGGRAAEELVFNEVTTGAANDIEKVTATAKQMIMRYGMSDKLGPRVLGRNQDMPFLGREMASEPDYSEDMARVIDDEIFAVIENAHMRARKVLEDNIDELHKLSAILIERETIDKDQFLRLLAGETEEAVFPPEPEPATPEEKDKAADKRKRLPRPKPFPLPGQAMQPPPAEGAQP